MEKRVMCFNILKTTFKPGSPFLFMIPCVLLPLSLCVGGTGAFAEMNSGNKAVQIQRIEEELSREKELFFIFGEKEKGLLDQLSRLEKAIAEKSGLIEDIKTKIGKVKEELKQQQARLAELERSRKEIEDRLARRLVAFYKHAKRGYIYILATSKDLHQLRKRLRHLRALTGEDLSLIGRLADVRQKCQQEISENSERLATIERLKQLENERLVSLNKDIDTKVLLLMKVHKEKEFYETAVKELEIAAQNLGNTILDLEKTSDTSGEATNLPTDFSKARGKLPFPFPGKIVKRFKPLKAEHRTSLKGIYIEGPPGGEVRAVYPGRVDYSGWLKGYGQIVIVNHGSRYFTVSAHLSRRDKEKGDRVREGEVIGRLGDSQSLIGARLYFEIRTGGGNLDPLEWLKVH